MIYVLIVVALFAALGFTLSRQTDTGETGVLSQEELIVYTNQLIQQANQVKQAVDQMMFSGTRIDQLDFVQPGEANFDTAPNIHKVFHPSGGGVVLPNLREDYIEQIGTDPVAGWYLGRFNDVEWTQSTNEDVILVAYQVREDICQRINETLHNSSTIPPVTPSMGRVLIDSGRHTQGANSDLDTTNCAGCENFSSLCVRNAANTAWAFYSVIAQQ